MNHRFIINCKCSIDRSRRTLVLRNALRKYIGEIIIQEQFGFTISTFYRQLEITLEAINRTFNRCPLQIHIADTREHGIRFIFRDAISQYSSRGIIELILSPLLDEAQTTTE